MNVFFSELAEKKVLKISEYLLEKWNLKTKETFISKLTEKIKQISIHPESCPKSSEFLNLYKCVVTKQTTLYYRISFEKKEIEVITILDSRQNPGKLNNDIN